MHKKIWPLTTALTLATTACGGKTALNDGYYDNTDIEENDLDGGITTDGEITTDAEQAPDSAVIKACDELKVRFNKAASISPTTVPVLATNIPMICVDMTSGCEDNDISDLYYVQQGIDQTPSFETTISDETGKRWTAFQYSSNLVFSSLDQHVPAYQTKTICLSANTTVDSINSSANYKLTQVITGKNNAKGLPISGSTITVGEFDESQFIETANVIELDGKGSAVESGGKNRPFAAFSACSDGKGMAKRVTLQVDGTCDPEQLENFRLYDAANMEQLDLVPSTRKIPTKRNNYNGDIYLIDFKVDFPVANCSYYQVNADIGCEPGTQIVTNFNKSSDFYVQTPMNQYGMFAGGYSDDGKGNPSVVNVTYGN